MQRFHAIGKAVQLWVAACSCAARMMQPRHVATSTMTKHGALQQQKCAWTWGVSGWMTIWPLCSVLMSDARCRLPSQCTTHMRSYCAAMATAFVWCSVHHIHCPAITRGITRVLMCPAAYISEVNHHQGLYKALARALGKYEADSAQAAGRDSSNTAIGAATSSAAARTQSLASGSEPVHQGQPHGQQPEGWCEEAVMVGRALIRDMQQAGIHLPTETQRARMQELMNANAHYAAQFNHAQVRCCGGNACVTQCAMLCVHMLLRETVIFGVDHPWLKFLLCGS